MNGWFGSFLRSRPNVRHQAWSLLIVSRQHLPLLLPIASSVDIASFPSQTEHVQFILFSMRVSERRATGAFVHLLPNGNCIVYHSPSRAFGVRQKRRQVLHHHDLFRLLFGSSQMRACVCVSHFPFKRPISVEKSSFLAFDVWWSVHGAGGPMLFIRNQIKHELIESESRGDWLRAFCLNNFMSAFDGWTGSRVAFRMQFTIGIAFGQMNKNSNLWFERVGGWARTNLHWPNSFE